MQTFAAGRIGVGIGALGVAEAAFEEAKKYSKQRVQFGRSISSFQAIQHTLADMATEIEGAKYLLYRAAWLLDQGKPFEKTRFYGQTIRLGGSHEGDYQSSPDPGRLWLY